MAVGLSYAYSFLCGLRIVCVALYHFDIISLFTVTLLIVLPSRCAQLLSNYKAYCFILQLM